MYADLVLYTEPTRPLINPRFDLFAWINPDPEPILFPARVFDHVQLTLPNRCRLDNMNEDIWEFIMWQAEQKGYAVVRHIDNDWIYWSVLANKLDLLRSAHLI